MIEIHSITDVMECLDGLKVVLFDLDDTLYSEKEYVRGGFRAVAKILPQVENVEVKLWRAFENKKSAIDEVLNAEGIYSDGLKQKCLNIYRYHQPEIHLYDGAEKLLRELQNRNYLLGIITDGRPDGQRAKIKALRLDLYVSHIIVTDEFGGIEFRKPNERAFVYMKEMFRVEFVEMCYVGDNIKKDFLAPEKLGMKAIFFRNPDGIYC